MKDNHDIQITNFINEIAENKPDPDDNSDQSSFDEQVITAVDEVTTELDLPNEIADDNDS